VSNPTDTPDRAPVQEVLDHLDQALAALDRLRETLPPPSATSLDTSGGK
jgi:hypothetical protein